MTLVFTIIGCLLLIGIAWLGASCAPFSFWLAKTRNLTGNGQITFFTNDFYQAMHLRLMLLGAGNLTAAVVLLQFRRRVQQVGSRIAADFPAFSNAVKSAAGSVPTLDVAALRYLVAFAALLRVPLIFQPMRDDEAVTFTSYASRPFYASLSFYNTPNNHLFHTLLVRVAYLLFGNHP